MSGLIHYIGCGLSLLAAIGIMVTTIHHEWKKSSNVNSPGSLQYLHLTEGIWLRCVYPTPGLMQCDYFGTTLLALPGELHAMRAMVVLSEIFAFIGVIIAVYSLPCTTFQKKKALGIAAGVCMIMAGILCAIAVSIYASEVVNDFFAQDSRDIKYTFGPALYIGWVSSGLSVLSGLLLSIFAKTPKDTNVPPKGLGNKTAYI